MPPSSEKAAGWTAACTGVREKRGRPPRAGLGVRATRRVSSPCASGSSLKLVGERPSRRIASASHPSVIGPADVRQM
ncbi:Hypothetical predicted protein [Cloeon dipterum]|uniref:Uncharacterized protein n=1 Tax=Cloeon dipterum TaxID=197152 RepID=A0A8S1D8K8_9INSE|nr:Hypothetical predicted protein [Cloeon dipterum]